MGQFWNVQLLNTSSDSVESLFDILTENMMFMIAILVIVGLVAGYFSQKIRLPKVTGYIVAGLIVGPSILGFFNIHIVERLTIVRQAAIGFIGYTIGLELRFAELKKTGKQVTIITITQAVFTAVLVALAVALFVEDREHKWTYALILGAIATATAPAPIIAVVKGYKTEGPITNILLPLVAMDDVIGIMFFSIMLSLGTVLLNVSDQALTVSSMMLEPMREIGVSVGAGLFIGFIVVKILRKMRSYEVSDELYLLVLLGALFLGIGFGLAVHASAILLPMTFGAYVTNFVPKELEHKLSKIINLFSAPVILTFFMIAGMELNIRSLSVVGTVGVVYIAVRVLGKASGAYVSAKFVKAPKTVVKYLGWTLIPQAGVAIDMALTADMRFKTLALTHGDWIGDIGSRIMTIVLGATLVYEVFGLIVVKKALAAAGEISPTREHRTISATMKAE